MAIGCHGWLSWPRLSWSHAIELWLGMEKPNDESVLLPTVKRNVMAACSRPKSLRGTRADKKAAQQFAGRLFRVLVSGKRGSGRH